jgi:rubredoxin
MTMDRYRCTKCGYIYEPSIGDREHGVKPGTAFESLPADWVCPRCRAGKERFVKVEGK